MTGFFSTPQCRRRLLAFVGLLVFFSFVVVSLLSRTEAGHNVHVVYQAVRDNVLPHPTATVHSPIYKPTPTWTPPPIRDNFPLLQAGPKAKPPAIPAWNIPKKNLHKDYNLTIAPPLLIGFTRSWPLLLQAVVSYLTAGWPANQIYVVENTGVHDSNALGQLSMQNPFFLNHTVLKSQLGVNIVQTPVLLSFAQLQNYYVHLSHEHDWPFYFWSHMDVLALSFEDGGGDMTPQYDQPGYKSLYELACEAASDFLPPVDDAKAVKKLSASLPQRLGARFFAYDHLALVNPRAYRDVGGWDTLIPYYMTDCDMHSRLAMRNWTIDSSKRVGIVTDVSVALKDLAALYRVPGVVPEFFDPNPPPPADDDIRKTMARAHDGLTGYTRSATNRGKDSLVPSFQLNEPSARVAVYRPDVGLVRRSAALEKEAEYPLEAWRALVRTADSTFHYKHGGRERNTWQLGQRGGQGEPFYYDAMGLAAGLDIVTEAGREVFRHKWGHRDCNLIEGTSLQYGDQWRVEKDWE